MNRMLVCLTLCGCLAIGCAAPAGGSLDGPTAAQGSASDDAPCRGSAAPPLAILDPIYGSSATITPHGTPVPTCTPGPGTTPTPGPTPTSMPTQVAGYGSGPSIRIASAPQNLTLSPNHESLGRAAAGGGVRAVTWDRSLTLLTGAGTKTMPASVMLGVEAEAGVAVSPRGRIHVVGGRRYTYSDDGGVSWVPPVFSPVSRDPHMVVDWDGRVRAFWRAGGVILTAKQELDGTWGGETSLGAGGDYDAVRARDCVVALTSSPALVYRFPGGRAAALERAGRVDLHYDRGELLAGMVRGGDRAVIGRSLDGGFTWEECLVQRVGGAVRDVAVVPTEQGPYAVLWILDDGTFPSVMVSRVHWRRGARCGVWPEPGQVDELERAPFIHAPRLFAIGCPQTHFRVVGHAGSSLMAFTCLDGGGRADIFASRMAASGFFSGPSHGGARAGEEAPYDDYLGDLP